MIKLFHTLFYIACGLGLTALVSWWITGENVIENLPGFFTWLFNEGMALAMLIMAIVYGVAVIISKMKKQ